MCGIFAAFNVPGVKGREQSFLSATNCVSHRGPDNEGHYSDDYGYFGHTRLAILDLEPRSNQPFIYEQFVLVFNGEIFNFIEIRAELEALGYSFFTSSDTEVVIKAFERWGGACFEKFNGMWALAIYDRKKLTVTISRDRFGQKPLFLLREGLGLFIASEIQQLAPFATHGPDYGLIQMFLKEGTYEGGNRTFIRSVEVFPKAHYWEVDLAGEVKSTRYWDYWDGKLSAVSDDTFDSFSALLKDAVKIRTRSDVPIGVLLSGGVDSTIISAFAKEALAKGTPLLAFTYGSNDEYDESRFAQSVAGKLELSLTIRTQERSYEDFRERLKTLVRNMGRGHSSPAIVSVDYLYESVAKAGIKVALDGQGADELLGGYQTYYPELILTYLRRGQFQEAYYCLRDQIEFGFVSSIILYLRNKLPAYARKLMRSLYGYERLFSRYQDPCDNHSSVTRRKSKNASALNRYLIFYHELGLENLLYYGDIVAMKNSVENRSPFLDHRLVDFSFGSEEALKVYRGQNKYALRKTRVYEMFREELDRRKIGFSSDIGLDIKKKILSELRLSPIVSWPIFSKTFKTVLDGEIFLSMKYERLLFRIYQVHLWAEIFGPILLRPRPNR